ncbi:MAG TPA: hypothetical protein VFO31_07335 [Vicinamibacterales bacterium]|nr:hypothetical protein [Vicinamibacterales bacterium]
MADPSFSTLLQAVLVTFGAAAGLAPLLERRRILRRSSAADVSLAALAFTGAGCALWLIYGVAIGSWPLAVAQTAGLVAIVITLRAARRQREPRLEQVERPAPAPSDSAAGFVPVSAEITVSDLFHQGVFLDGQRRLVLDHRHRAVGTLTTSDIARVKLDERSSTLVGDIAEPLVQPAAHR